MLLFWLVLILAIVLVAGSALTLLRTARKPRLPDQVEPKPYADDEDGGW